MRDEAAACARTMLTTPHGPMVRYEVSRYETSQSPRRRVDFAVAFPSFDAFLLAIRDEDPGALEAGLEILSRVAPAQTLDLARTILEAKPWKEMGSRIGAALSRVDDPAAVDLALANTRVPYVITAIRASVCARAEPAVLAALEGSPALRTSEPCEDRHETMLVEALLGFLGRHRSERAWPRVAALYREHHDRDVRLGAGHALLAYGDARSLELLASFAASEEDPRTFFAVKALLARDPARAIDALGGLDALRAPSSRAIAKELMDQVARSAHDSRRAIADARMLDLALWWVKDRDTKDVAQWVLDGLGPEAVAAAKKRLARGAPPTRRKPTRRKPTKKEIERARLSIERARTNLERIVAELRAMGYLFQAGEPLAPRADRRAAIEALETALAGPLPVSLRLALEIIGPCSLIGTFPGQPSDLESDPFVLLPVELALDQARDEGGREAQVSLAIAPDRVGKAGFSGGQEVILVPDSAIDGRVLGVPGEPLFLDRLRDVFRSGGFPGLQGATGPLRAVVDRLAAVCEPI